MAVHGYTPKSIVMGFDSIPLIGFGDAEFVTVARAGDLWELQKGAGGDSCVVELTDESAIATVTLLAGGITNDLLTAKVIAGKRTKRPFGEWSLDDLFGTTMVHADRAFIMNLPEITFGKDGPQREWKFCLVDAEIISGGSVLS